VQVGRDAARHVRPRVAKHDLHDVVVVAVVEVVVGEVAGRRRGPRREGEVVAAADAAGAAAVGSGADKGEARRGVLLRLRCCCGRGRGSGSGGGGGGAGVDASLRRLCDSSPAAEPVAAAARRVGHDSVQRLVRVRAASRATVARGRARRAGRVVRLEEAEVEEQVHRPGVLPGGQRRRRRRPRVRVVRAVVRVLVREVSAEVLLLRQKVLPAGRHVDDVVRQMLLLLLHVMRVGGRQERGREQRRGDLVEVVVLLLLLLQLEGRAASVRRGRRGGRAAAAAPVALLAAHHPAWALSWAVLGVAHGGSALRLFFFAGSFGFVVEERGRGGESSFPFFSPSGFFVGRNLFGPRHRSVAGGVQLR